MLNKVIAVSGLLIDCIDRDGRFLSACGGPALLRESEFNGFVTGCDVSIERQGTTSNFLLLMHLIINAVV